VGKQADIILIDTQNISIAPSVNPVSSVVLYAKENHVDTVMVAGKIVKRHGRLIYPHLEELMENARKSASRILNKKPVEVI
jgi:cytosine/adenosine deaminase-related metal-dependent hydrolase